MIFVCNFVFYHIIYVAELYAFRVLNRVKCGYRMWIKGVDGVNGRV